MKAWPRIFCKVIIGGAILAAPVLAHAQTEVFCTDNGDGTCSIQGIPFATSMVGYEGVYPDESTILDHGGSWSPWASCSGDGCVNGGNQPIPTDSASAFQGFGSSGISTFWLRMTSGGCSGGGCPDASSPLGEGEYWVQFSGGSPVPPPQGTAIYTLLPSNGDTQATDTPVALASTGFVAEGDVNSGLILRYVLKSAALAGAISQCADVVCSVEGGAGLYSQTIDDSLAPGSTDLPSGSGYFSVSTTTSLTQIGQYTLTASIMIPAKTYFFGLISFGGNTLVSTSTTFIVGTTTAAQSGLQGIINGLGAALTQPNTGTSSPGGSVLNACDPLDFTLTDCIAALFLPDPADISAVWNSAESGFLSVVPFGYITLITQDLSTTTTTSLPALSYTFPSNFPVPLFASTTWSFDFGTILAAGADIASSTMSTGDDPENVWSIIMPLFSAVVWVFLAFIIVEDLLGLYNHAPAFPQGHPTDDKEELNEWLYNHRR